MDCYALRPKPSGLPAFHKKDSAPEPAEGSAAAAAAAPKTGYGQLALSFARALETFSQAPGAPSASLGSLRLKYKYVEEVVLPEMKYHDLMTSIAQNNYLLPVLLGRVVNDREDAAWAFVRYYDYYGEATQFLSAIIEHEVENTRKASFAFHSECPAPSPTSNLLPFPPSH